MSLFREAKTFVRGLRYGIYQWCTDKYVVYNLHAQDDKKTFNALSIEEASSLAGMMAKRYGWSAWVVEIVRQ